MIKRFLLVLAIGVMSGAVQAQQLPAYSQYSMNRFLLNPAVAGIDGYTTIGLTAHEQWLGFKGAPRSHSISCETKIHPDSYILREMPVRKKERKGTRLGNVGIGGHLFNDHFGPIDRTGLEATYAYHINFEKFLFSMGMSLNFFQLRINNDKLVLPDDEYDVLIHDSKNTLYSPDASLGIYALAEKFYAGLSTVNVMQSAVQFGKNYEGNFRLKRQHNLMAGYRYTVDENIQLEPSFLLKIPESRPAQLDIQVKTFIQNNYWAGIGVRTGWAMYFFGGAKIDRYFIGYAFDMNFNALMRNSLGSHEILFAVKFGDTARRYRWLNTY